MRSVNLDLFFDEELYREVLLDKLAHARESVWLSTANLKATLIERRGAFVPILDLFAELAGRGVALRILHAELPSRPFRREFDARRALVRGGLELKICPRIHMKCVIIDGAWLYLGSANLTGAGLGAKGEHRRNFEAGICTEDFAAIDAVSARFDAIWRGAECYACKLRNLCPDPLGPGPTKRAPRRRRSIRGMWKAG